MGGLGTAGLADQRLGQALRVTHVVETEAPLDAEPLVIRRAVAAFDVHDPVILDVVRDLAADAAVRTDGRDPAIDRLHERVVRRRERAGRTRLHAFTARHARGCAHRVVEVEHDFRVRGAKRVPDHVVDLLLATRAHAARALDAGIEVDGHRRVRQVGRRLYAPRKTRLADAELALPEVEFGRRLVAALGHVRGEQLDDHLLRMHGARARARHVHAGGRLATARRRQHALALDLDHARAAVAVGTVAGLVAE